MIHKEELRAVLGKNATRTFHDEETDLIEMLMPRAIKGEVVGRLEEGKLLLNSGY